VNARQWLASVDQIRQAPCWNKSSNRRLHPDVAGTRIWGRSRKQIANIEELVRAAAESEERGRLSSSSWIAPRCLPNSISSILKPVRLADRTQRKGWSLMSGVSAGLEEGLFPHFQSRDSKEDMEEEPALCYGWA